MAQLFTVRVENEPGALATLAEALAEQGVDVRSVGAAVVERQGYVVLTTNNDTTTRAVLREAGYTFAEGEILKVYVEDQPGSLARLGRKLADAGVNIQGILLLGRHQGKAELALTVDDLPKARRALGI